MTIIVGRERPRPEWLRAHPRAWLAAVATVCFGAFMGQLDASVVALTYHSIGTDFHAGLASVQWISLTYLIALGALLIPFGRLSDRIGRKRVYLWGFALFTVASAGCALAPSLPALAALRAVQGSGAAMLQANSVAIVATAAPRRRLQAALGMQAAAQAIGLAVGPSLGGLIVQTVGWRAVFALNIPVGCLALVAGRYLLPRTRVGSTAPPGLRAVLGAPGVARGLSGALLAYLLLFGPIVLVPSVLEQGGRTPLTAGLLVALLPAGFAAGALAGERIVPRRWTTARRCRLGIGLAVLGFAALVSAAPHLGGWAVALAVVGAGLGIFTPANNAQVMASTPGGTAALAGGLVSAGRAAGTAAGTVLVASTLALAANGTVPAGVLLALACAAVVTVPRAARHPV